MSKYPDDSDGDALQRLADSGADMTKPMMIDFTIVAPNEQRANEVANWLGGQEYSTSASRDEETSEWLVIATLSVVPEYDHLMEIQDKLSKELKNYDCELDGWGSFGND